MKKKPFRAVQSFGKCLRKWHRNTSNISFELAKKKKEKIGDLLSLCKNKFIRIFFWWKNSVGKTFGLGVQLAANIRIVFFRKHCHEPFPKQRELLVYRGYWNEEMQEEALYSLTCFPGHRFPQIDCVCQSSRHLSRLKYQELKVSIFAGQNWLKHGSCFVYTAHFYHACQDMVVFSSSTCPFCVKALGALKDAGNGCFFTRQAWRSWPGNTFVDGSILFFKRI